LIISADICLQILNIGRVINFVTGMNKAIELGTDKIKHGQVIEQMNHNGCYSKANASVLIQLNFLKEKIFLYYERNK